MTMRSTLRGTRRGGAAGRGARASATAGQGWLWGEPLAAASRAQNMRGERGGSAALLRYAFDQDEDACVIVDRLGRLVQVNRRAGSLGLRKGGNLAPLGPAAGGDILAAIRRGADAALREGRASDTACAAACPAGQARQGRVSCMPLVDEAGEVAGARCIVRFSQEGGASLVAEGIKVAGGRLVHDYNNLLTVLLGNLSMAVADAQGEDRELLQAAQEAAIAARGLTQTLPRRLAAAVEAARTALPSGGTAATACGRPRILLMDDEKPVREVAARILEAADYEVSQASDGRTALQMFHAARVDMRPFRLAVLDLTVSGGMGGEEAGRALQALDPALPILISTGRLNGLTAQECERLGFSGVVPKPYTADELRTGVQAALGPDSPAE